MNDDARKAIVAQLKAIISEYYDAAKKCGDLSKMHATAVQRLCTRTVAAIDRIGGKGSSYEQEVSRITAKQRIFDWKRLRDLIGVVQALMADIGAGYLDKVEEILHASVFADFLDMAVHLLENGYKDPAAVITGSTLENHLRLLCRKSGVDTTTQSVKGQQPKKADSMNSDLAGKQVYSKLDQKSVTAWLDLRNNAAHGDYAAYTAEQVGLMITGVRDFIVRNPA